MAEAKTVKRSSDIQLSLTEEEARTLRLVLVRVGGEPVETPRRDTAAVSEALDSVLDGGYEADLAAAQESFDIEGTLMFYRKGEDDTVRALVDLMGAFCDGKASGGLAVLLGG